METEEPQSKRIKESSDQELKPNKADSDEGPGAQGQLGQEEAAEKVTRVMTNPVVLANIATRLPSADLLTLRQTCPEWNSSFVPQLRKKHRTIELDGYTLGPRSSPRMSRAQLHPTDKSLQKYIEVMRSTTTGQFPFSKYEVMNCKQSLEGFGSVAGAQVTQLDMNWIWKENEDWETSCLRRALFEQMPLLTKLDLTFNGQWNPKPPESSSMTVQPQPQPLRTVRTQELPNLKTFRFVYSTEHDASTCAQLVSALIQAATGLEHLQLPSPLWKQGNFASYLAFLRSTLTQMRDFNVNIRKLKRLKISEVNRGILQTLVEMAGRKSDRLLLKTFSICVTGNGWQIHHERDEDWRNHRRQMERILETFLDLQAPTLRGLSIWRKFSDEDELTSIALPRMAQLHSLSIKRLDLLGRITETTKNKFGLRCQEETFAHNFPALKRLEYYINDNLEELIGEGEEDDPTLTLIAHPGVTHLVVDANVQLLDDLTTHFPCVTSVELHMRTYVSDNSNAVRDEYAAIWTRWPSLKSLQLTLDHDSDDVTPDEFLTGVPKEKLPNLKAEIGKLEPSPTLEALGPLARKWSSRPSICDLNRLEEFTLFWRYESGSRIRSEWSKLSDTGAYYGLALAGAHLKKMQIRVSGPERGNNNANGVSEDCVQFLKGVWGPDTVIDLFVK